MNRASAKQYGRFRFVHEPLDSIDKNEETHRPDFPFSAELLKRRYPVRALRYWWLARVIDEEVKRLDHPPVIVDVGCDRGIIKRFIAPIEGSEWIGLDMDINRPGVELANYDRRIEADFDEGLPVDNELADIAICSHVLEHLPRPEFTMREIQRILKPGGLLLVGVPTLPKFMAKLREKQFAKQLANGSRVMGQHIHVFWEKRLRKLAESAGFEVEFSSGTSLIRKRGSKLEDYAAWIRFNQAVAAMFPGIGQELCMQLRKPSDDKL
ncbi:MAG TPA: class I SAM-dependent methyltransferase [Pyrinomonadaceae bacterium]|nr:class I SAM-dependent methyltransferase [Pyrinomonadaceae bacterium]